MYKTKQMKPELQAKKERLRSVLSGFDSLAIAYSGGVDSSLLLASACEILGDNKAVAVTAVSPVHPEREQKAAEVFAAKLGIRHIVVKSKEMAHEEFLANTADRCYICKKYLFSDFTKIAADMGISSMAHGANLDDLEDYRPGFRATREMEIAAPLVDAGLTKDDIRALSKHMGLSTWDKPALACLATRIPYGTRITVKSLNMVEQAEDFILSLGFHTCRVRHHGDMASIEVAPGDIEKILDEQLRHEIAETFRKIGFSHTAVDMEGYVQGKMNRALNKLP